MPVPGKYRTPIGSVSGIASLRSNGAAFACFVQSGLKAICGTLRLSAHLAAISSAPLGDPPCSSTVEGPHRQQTRFIKLSFTKRDQIAQSLGAVCSVQKLGKFSDRIIQERLAIIGIFLGQGMQIECVHPGGFGISSSIYLFEELARGLVFPRARLAAALIRSSPCSGQRLWG